MIVAPIVAPILALWCTAAAPPAQAVELRLGAPAFKLVPFHDSKIASAHADDRVAVADERRLYVFDAKGVVTHDVEQPAPARCGPIAWAPDDSTIACGGSRFHLGTSTWLHAENVRVMSPDPTGWRVERADRSIAFRRGDETVPIATGGGPRWEDAALVPDGGRIAVLGLSNDARLIDVQQKRDIPIGSDSSFDIAISADGARIATHNHSGVVFYDALGKETARYALTPVGTSGGAIAFAPDGKTLVVTTGSMNGGAIVVLDAATGRARKTIVVPNAELPLRYLTWGRPDTANVVLASFGVLRTFDTKTGTEVIVPGRFLAPQRAVAWSADGTTIAVGGDDGVRTFNSATGALVAETRGPAVAAVVFDAKGVVQTNGAGVTLQEGPKPYTGMIPLGAGRAIVAGVFEVSIIDATTKGVLATVKTQHTAPLAMALSPDHTRVAIADHGGASIVTLPVVP